MMTKTIMTVVLWWWWSMTVVLLLLILRERRHLHAGVDHGYIITIIIIVSALSFCRYKNMSKYLFVSSISFFSESTTLWNVLLRRPVEINLMAKSFSNIFASSSLLFGFIVAISVHLQFTYAIRILPNMLFIMKLEGLSNYNSKD